MNGTPNVKGSTTSRILGLANDNPAVLERNIRRALRGYFGKDQKLVEVKVGRVEGDRIFGFLKLISEEKGENFLLDFQATSASAGRLLSLEVDGKDVKRKLPRRNLILPR